MADFALRARDIGVDYVGICCGGGPHHVRAMAEALGRTTPASRYSPAIELHPVLGAPRSRTEVMGGWAASRAATPVGTTVSLSWRQSHLGSLDTRLNL